MKKLLIPHRFKKIGFILHATGIVISLHAMITQSVPDWLTVPVFSVLSEGTDTNNITDEICTFLIVIGGMMVIFSREKVEDDIIQEMRNNAYAWCFIIHFGILLVCDSITYDFTFLRVMMFNLFTPLIIYIAHFHTALYITNKQAIRNGE